MKKPLLLLVLLALTISAGAETPYEVFGHKGKTLETKLEKGGGIIELINTDTTSEVGRLLFDFKNMKFTAYGRDNCEIARGEILPTVSKKWWSRDPKADEFPDKAPYIFVSCNPINRIDPTGEADYFSDDGKFLGNDGVNNNDIYYTTIEIYNNSVTNGNWSGAQTNLKPNGNSMQVIKELAGNAESNNPQKNNKEYGLIQKDNGENETAKSAPKETKKPVDFSAFTALYNKLCADSHTDIGQLPIIVFHTHMLNIPGDISPFQSQDEPSSSGFEGGDLGFQTKATAGNLYLKNSIIYDPNSKQFIYFNSSGSVLKIQKDVFLQGVN